MRLRTLSWSIPLSLVVFLLPACSDDADDVAATTTASTTTVIETTTTGLTRTTKAPATTTTTTQPSDPTLVLEVPELADWEGAAVEFFDRFYEEWPDLEDRFSEFADDAVFYAPTFGDYWIGRERIISGWGMMPSVFPDLEVATDSVFLSAGDAVFVVDWINFWVGEKPSDVPWPAGLEAFRFDDGRVASQDLWYTAETLEGPMKRCGGCTADILSMAERYVAAWSSGDADQIAALYSANATLSDRMFGVSVASPEEIASSVDERFGQGEVTMTIEGIYGTTLGSSLVGPDSPSNAGDITGVGVHFKWATGGQAAGTVESLALLYFGSVDDRYYQPTPQDLILREEIFHNPDTLTAFTR